MATEVKGSADYLYLLRTVGSQSWWDPIKSPAEFIGSTQVVVVSEPGRSAKQGLTITPGNKGERTVVDGVLLNFGEHHEYRDKGFPLVTVF